MKFNDKGRYIPKRIVKEKKLPDAEDYCKEGWCVCPGCWKRPETKMRPKKELKKQQPTSTPRAEPWSMITPFKHLVEANIKWLGVGNSIPQTV